MGKNFIIIQLHRPVSRADADDDDGDLKELFVLFFEHFHNIFEFSIFAFNGNYRSLKNDVATLDDFCLLYNFKFNFVWGSSGCFVNEFQHVCALHMGQIVLLSVKSCWGIFQRAFHESFSELIPTITLINQFFRTRTKYPIRPHVICFHAPQAN